MTDKFSFKKGARLPSREMTLTSSTDFNLQTADSVTFVYRKKGVAERNTIAPVILSPTKIRVDFGSIDVDEIAQYEWHVEAVFSSKRMDFPERSFFTFSVTETIETP